MQYGIDVFPYERVSNVREKKEVKKTINLNLLGEGIISFLVCLFVSRVPIISSMAPCGVALLISILLYVDNRLFLFPCAGCVLGYISIHNNICEVGRYVLAIVLISVIYYTLRKFSKAKKVIFTLSLIFLEFIMYKLFILQKPLGMSFLFSSLEMACIFPLYFIIDHSILCFKDINTKYLFNSEELITMAIFMSLLIAGTYGIKIFNISITNILALGFIIILSYVSGSAIGSAAGISLGAIIGMGSGSLSIYTSLYGLCALVAGAFKEMGKCFTALAYFITFLIITIYSKNFHCFKIIEPIIAILIFMFIPKNFYDRLNLEINRVEKEKYISGEYINKVKNMFTNKLDNFSDVLDNMSITLMNLSKNENLSMKNKSTSLIENLADRVCSNCNMKSMCWKREMHYTYSAFSELIQNYQSGFKGIPKEINKKCINKEILLQNTEEIVNNYIINELLNKRFHEGRQILSEQISNMADSLKQVVNEFSCGINFNVSLERDIIRVLHKENIKFSDITCFTDNKDRVVLKLRMKSCVGKQMCVKRILPLIDEVVGKSMCIEEEGCFIDPATEECAVTFKEMPKYHISTCVKGKCKDGEECNGDSYNFGNGCDGNYMMLLSDGMGSGPEASEESGAVVELIEKFISSGFRECTAINAVNSIMSLKFYEEEKFSTVDLVNIDLYNGQAEFVKVGAAATFIKRGKDVKVIMSKSLPIGILDKIDADVTEYDLENGDLIIMVSDGVVDYNNENVCKNDWIINYLKENDSNQPKEILEGLIEKSINLSNGKVRDDMTVMVSKVYNLY